MQQQIPRAEHPNPQFERKNWQTLNGIWQFEMDHGCSGVQRGLYKTGTALQGEILVPFCPESSLSGIGHTDFMQAVWYKRTVSITREQLEGNVFLHFGAVDYDATVYVNGTEAGCHQGGYTSFSFAIGALLHEGENELAVYAKDDVRDRMVPRGKQSEQYFSHACDYTRTTGIWQSVWLEFVPAEYIQSVQYYPDAQNATLAFHAQVVGSGTLLVQAFYEGRLVGSVQKKAASGSVTGEIQLCETHLWEPGAGRLYTLQLQFCSDEVASYFGLRSLRLDGYRFLLNEHSVFQRLVLDQGFYPDGIYTAPDDAALVRDITLSLDAGFNGARLHEKVFEPRFLYHCDRLGYLVWGEFPNWGLDHTNPQALYAMLPQWCEAVARDFNHPAIVGWCPFNETWDQDGRKQHDDLLRLVYQTTKRLDPTRPCIDTSGNYHVQTDIYDVHNYEQDVATFREQYAPLVEDGILFDRESQRAGMQRQSYTEGQPTFVSEYGGIQWSVPADKTAWGYGNAPKTEEEFIERYRGLTDTLLDNPKMLGMCYTQLYDIEQEQNGLYTYAREPKFDMAIFHEINSRKAAIED